MGLAGNTVYIRFTDATGGTGFDGSSTVTIQGKVISRTLIESDPDSFPTITSPRLMEDMLSDLTVILLRPTLWPSGTGSFP